MIHVAKEMEREGLDIPLLIGGATTTKWSITMMSCDVMMMSQDPHSCQDIALL
jgi:cobalamin-dependent methionine synthase I